MPLAADGFLKELRAESRHVYIVEFGHRPQLFVQTWVQLAAEVLASERHLSGLLLFLFGPKCAACDFLDLKLAQVRDSAFAPILHGRWFDACCPRCIGLGLEVPNDLFVVHAASIRHNYWDCQEAHLMRCL